MEDAWRKICGMLKSQTEHEPQRSPCGSFLCYACGRIAVHKYQINTREVCISCSHVICTTQPIPVDEQYMADHPALIAKVFFNLRIGVALDLVSGKCSWNIPIGIMGGFCRCCPNFEFGCRMISGSRPMLVCPKCANRINNIVSMIHLSPLIFAISTNNYDVDEYLHKTITNTITHDTLSPKSTASDAT